ncbi:MAG: efflux transporter outer membrane subunit [Gammaproteobacteria bacterium]|nr:efflux transporter outer membrane subunit [Gammaproteobacteria bacterium]MBQ0840767.1 efflux transporter outer membrane subunit [Gammaproteobacteria bacterium]
MPRFGRLTVYAALISGSVSLISGCALTPDYERPPLAVPSSYAADTQLTSSTGQGESIANLPWWQVFEDAQLQALIRSALAENKDLGVALSRIAQANAQLTSTRANQFPFFDVSGSAGRGRQSQLLIPGAGIEENFSIMGNLSFELDLWRKLSRATESARAELLANEAAHRHVSLTIVANVARTYLLLLDLDQRLVIARRTVDSRQGSLAIIQARFDKGTVPELDVNQAQVELAVAEVAVATFQRQIAQTEHSLSILLGRNPGAIKRGLSLMEQQLLPEIPTGLPSELLQRRPDVVAAEQQLHAETALIGVAEALRYPSLSLTGSYGGVSDDLSDLNDSDAESWGVAGNIFAPILNWGQLKAQSEAQRARTEQALQNYEATLQQAFREVADALVAVDTYRQEYEAYHRQAVAAGNAERLSRARYDAGVVDYLEVLESSRSMFNAELNESASFQAAMNALVELYQSLGGGWTAEESAATSVKAP